MRGQRSGKMKKMVSVIIPMYNAEKYIENCLNSVHKQTYGEYEVLVVNDGSNDGSELVVNNFVKIFGNKLKILKKENGGLSSARNYGLDYAIGKYVTFLDADDYIEKDYLEVLVNAAEKYQSDVICSGQYKVKEDGNILKTIRYTPQNGKSLTKRLNISGKLYKKDYLDKWHLRFPKGKTYEDNPFNLQALFLSKKNYYLDYSGYYQVVHEGSITSKKICIEEFPLEALETGIKTVLKNDNGDMDKMLFEFTVLSFFTYFLFVRNKKNEYLKTGRRNGSEENALLLADNFEKIVCRNFPDATHNKYASVWKYRQLQFTQRLGVKVFICLCHKHKLKKFVRLYYHL